MYSHHVSRNSGRKRSNLCCYFRGYTSSFWSFLQWTGERMPSQQLIELSDNQLKTRKHFFCQCFNQGDKKEACLCYPWKCSLILWGIQKWVLALLMCKLHELLLLTLRTGVYDPSVAGKEHLNSIERGVSIQYTLIMFQTVASISGS